MTEEENKEKRREYRRKWYAKNREKKLENNRKWKAANPEKRREWIAANPEKYTTKNLFHSARNRAKAKGLPFTLTKGWVAERVECGKCELSGISFNLEAKRGMQGPYSPSIDKIVPELGYIPENCRMILYGLNALKSTGTDEDIMNIAKALIEYNR